MGTTRPIIAALIDFALRADRAQQDPEIVIWAAVTRMSNSEQLRLIEEFASMDLPIVANLGDIAEIAADHIIDLCTIDPDFHAHRSATFQRCA